MSHQIFISYSRTDSEWISEELLPSFRSLGISTFIDDGKQRKVREELANEHDEERKTKTQLLTDGLSIGDKLGPAISEAIQSSSILIAVLSKDYFDSEWCTFELQIYRELVSQSQDPPKLIQVILRDCRRRLDKNTVYSEIFDVRKRQVGLLDVLRPLAKNDEQILIQPLGKPSFKHFKKSKKYRKLSKSLKESSTDFINSMNKVVALKFVHDTLQDSQLQWDHLNNYYTRSGGNLNEKVFFLVEYLNSMFEKCEVVSNKKSTLEAFGGFKPEWLLGVEKCIEQMTSFLALDDGNISGKQIILRKAVETILHLTSAILFKSATLQDLEKNLRRHAATLSLENVRTAFQGFHSYSVLNWNHKTVTFFSTLDEWMENLEKDFIRIKALTRTHGTLQDIDSIIRLGNGLGPNLTYFTLNQLKQKQKTITSCDTAEISETLERMFKEFNILFKKIPPATQPNSENFYTSLIPQDKESETGKQFERFRRTLDTSFRRADNELLKKAESFRTIKLDLKAQRKP